MYYCRRSTANDALYVVTLFIEWKVYVGYTIDTVIDFDIRQTTKLR